MLKKASFFGLIFVMVFALSASASNPLIDNALEKEKAITAVDWTSNYSY